MLEYDGLVDFWSASGIRGTQWQLFFSYLKKNRLKFENVMCCSLQKGSYTCYKASTRWKKWYSAEKLAIFMYRHVVFNRLQVYQFVRWISWSFIAQGSSGIDITLHPSFYTCPRKSNLEPFFLGVLPLMPHLNRFSISTLESGHRFQNCWNLKDVGPIPYTLSMYYTLGQYATL